MTTERLKMMFGFCVLVLLTILAAIIALGQVRSETSFGLSQILGGLLVLAGGFSQWAFGKSSSEGRNSVDSRSDSMT